MQNEFEEKVAQQIELLSKGCLREIETASILKRTAWMKEHRPDFTRITPRLAYEMLFFDYMHLSKDEVPVQAESDTEIVWKSYNLCPTLEACKRLNLDTRKVCRAVSEKPTQAFLSLLDPQLRFQRSYEEIRPHAEDCREWIVRVDFEKMMEIAIQEAVISQQEGNKGYGAVVARGDRLLARAHDTAATHNDPSQHAEVNAIRQAVQAEGESNLSGAILFSTCEPCPMCSSLAVWANVTTIVYGASIEETARLGKARIRVSAQEIVGRSPVMIEVIGGVLKERCIDLYR